MVQFKDLALEIRSQIWADCLSNSDMQGVYFFDPEDFDIKDGTVSLEDKAESDWEVEREVIVAFPNIMHVCQESREYAKGHLSFREDTVRGISIPCRLYRPEKDAFFVPYRHFDDFIAAVRKSQFVEYNHGEPQKGAKAFCREIVHLALSSHMLMDEDVDTLGHLVPDLTALRVLSFVFGNTDTSDLSRPLTMVPLGKDKAELVPGQPRTRIHVEEALDNLMGQASLWELNDEETAPWDGEWLFDMEAEEMERVRGLV